MVTNTTLERLEQDGHISRMDRSGPPRKSLAVKNMAVEQRVKEQVYRHGKQRCHKTGGDSGTKKIGIWGGGLRMQRPEDGPSCRKSSSGSRRRTRRGG